MPSSKLEEEHLDTFNAWKAGPSPETTGALLRGLEPTIKRGINLYASDSNSPLLKGRARRITLKALDTYDPTQSRLQTHVLNHLKGLHRVARDQGNILHIPERASLEAAQLHAAELELNDQLGREPSAYELADHTRLSTRRIARLRQYKRAIPEGSLLARSQNEEGGGDYSHPALPGPQIRHIEYVYHDSDPIGQKIIEWSTGMHGAKQLSNTQIAAQLRITPGAVSQRKAVLQRRIDEAEALFHD